MLPKQSREDLEVQNNQSREPSQIVSDEDAESQGLILPSRSLMVPRRKYTEAH